MLNSSKIKQDFPMFEEKPELVYLDNAATSQKNERVIQRLNKFYTKENANAGRGNYRLANQAKENLRDTRQIVRHHIGSESLNEIIFTRGCTEGLNILASCLNITGDVLIPEMAHHSNILPWKKREEIKEDINIKKVKTEPYTAKISIDDLKRKISKQTAVISFSHISNIFGVVNPVEEIVEIANEYGALTILDGAQSVPRMNIDVYDLDIDFMVFSGHKMCAATGTGVLYGRKELLEEMNSYHVGGGTKKNISGGCGGIEACGDLSKGYFEAGTPNLSNLLTIKPAVSYLEMFDRGEIIEHEYELMDRLKSALKGNKKISVYDSKTSKQCLLSFGHKNKDVDKIAKKLDLDYNITVRSGHHCASIETSKMNQEGTLRASPYLYNSEEDIDKLIRALTHI